jgi:hypothetical protein
LREVGGKIKGLQDGLLSGLFGVVLDFWTLLLLFLLLATRVLGLLGSNGLLSTLPDNQILLLNITRLDFTEFFSHCFRELLGMEGGTAQQARQFLLVQEDCLKPKLRLRILGLLLASVSTNGATDFPLSLLFWIIISFSSNWCSTIKSCPEVFSTAWTSP